MNPVGSSYTFTLSFISITAGIYDVSRNHCFLQITETRITCIKAQHMALSNQTRQPSGKHAGTVVFNTLVVGMSPVNCLIEHYVHNNCVVHASRTGGRLVSALVSCRKHASVYFFAPCHFATVVRPTNHQSRVSATFLNSILPNMESCWDAISNS